jgi:hypothetical protein
MAITILPNYNTSQRPTESMFNLSWRFRLSHVVPAADVTGFCVLGCMAISATIYWDELSCGCLYDGLQLAASVNWEEVSSTGGRPTPRNLLSGLPVLLVPHDHDCPGSARVLRVWWVGLNKCSGPCRFQHAMRCHAGNVVAAGGGRER